MQGSNVIVAINKDGERADLRVQRPRRRRRPAPGRPEADRARRARGRAGERLGPAELPAAWRVEDALAVPTDADPIEVGILIVGAGPAGLACAIRLGQLLEEDPETARAARRRAGRRAREGQAARLAPALRRGAQPARPAAALQGPAADRRAAALRPGRARVRLLPDRRSAAMRIPTPPTMRNHGNYVASLSQLGRFLAERGRGGRRDDPARDARRRSCSSPTAASAASAPATAAGAGTARSSGTSSRGRTSLARVTVLAEGTQGHLTGAAIERFGLQGDEPAGLGARRQGGLEGREAARPRDPHDGLAAALARRSTASSAARSSTRWATTWSRSAWSSGSTTATPSSPCTTCSRS